MPNTRRKERPATDHPAAEPVASVGRLRCVIVEDQRMFSQLLVTMLRAGPGLDLEILAAAETVAEGIAACRRHRPDLLILDLALGDGRGEGVAEALLAANPRAKVVVLSAHAATFVCPQAMLPAIHAVVDKSDAFDTLQIVLGQLAGVAPATPAARDRLVEQLSHREQQVLVLVGQGLRSEEIASRLGITRNTVQSHRKKIAVKLGTEGMELSRYAYRYWQRLASDGRAG